jgi:hypothetical protein
LVVYSEAARALTVTELGRKAAHAVRLDSNFRSTAFMLELNRATAQSQRVSSMPRLCVHIVGLFVTELCDAALGAVHALCTPPSLRCSVKYS